MGFGHLNIMNSIERKRAKSEEKRMTWNGKMICGRMVLWHEMADDMIELMKYKSVIQFPFF